MEEVITSASNSTVKRLRRLLSSAKARRDENTYVAEGIHLAKSLLAAQSEPLLYVCAASALKNPEITELLQQGSTPTKRIVIADSLFESITHLHATVGIVAFFSPHVPKNPLTALAENAVLLEDIQDPGNLGTILRTTAATGVQTVILSPGCTSPWSPKALRAGMGAQFSLAIHENANLAGVIRTATVQTFSTTLTPDSTPLYTLDLTRPAAWLFGNEGQGVSDALATLTTTRVIIPQAATAVESLNVSAAAAVCLYEQFRQNNL